jgi:hypothetical protein
MTAASLRKKFKSKSFDQNHSIRIHRAISWIKLAEKTESLDVSFISYWIAFNSCYAQEIKDLKSKSERERLKEFVQNLTSYDAPRFYNLFWEIFTGPVRMLIDNVYVFEPFWSYQRGEINDYQGLHKKSIADATKYLSNNQIEPLMQLILERLYSLRNQLIHGGSTFESKLNRKQLKDARKLLSHLVPTIVDIMMEATDVEWGPITYPVIE